jgi:hypothetical protein
MPLVNIDACCRKVECCSDRTHESMTTFLVCAEKMQFITGTYCVDESGDACITNTRAFNRGFANSFRWISRSSGYHCHRANVSWCSVVNTTLCLIVADGCIVIVVVAVKLTLLLLLLLLLG